MHVKTGGLAAVIGLVRRGAARAAFFCALLLACGAAVAQERVEVSAQRLEGHGRLVFAFPDRLDLPAYEIRSDNGVLTIAFETGLETILPDIGTILADYVAIARVDPGRTSIRMGLRSAFQINRIEAGEQLYIDLLPTDWVGLPPGLPQEAIDRLARRAEEAARIAEERRRAEMVAEYNPTATVRMGRHPTFARIVFDWNVGTEARFSRDGQEGRIAFDWPVGIDLYPVLSDMPPEIVSASVGIDAAGSVVTFEIAEDTDMRFYEETPRRFVLDIDLPGGTPEGVAAETLLDPDPASPDDIGGPPPAASLAEAAPDAPPPPQESLTPFVTTVGTTLRLVFPFEEETPAAVFKRGDVVWMLFDTPVVIDPPQADRAFAAIAPDFTVTAGGGVQVVRMTLSPRRLATLGSQGRSWVLSLGDVLLDPVEPLILERRPTSAGGLEMTADLVRPMRVHQLRDPEVGDLLEVVTAYPPARGVVRDLDYVDFAAPRSIHGLVIRPRHEEVSVTLEDRLAVISGPRGLTLSPAGEHRFRLPESGAAIGMEMEGLLAADPVEFDERRGDILHRAANAEGRALDRARLDLARFYLGNDLAHEALGVLSVLEKGARQTELEPDIRLARAAANTLAGRYAEALAGLDAEMLRDKADTVIWRAIARAGARQFEGARLDALAAREIVEAYPQWLRTRFHLAGLEAAVERADTALAAQLLETIDIAVMTSDQIGRYELLSGRLDELNGRFESALESYGRVIAADRRSTTPEAVLRTVALLDAMDRLDAARAADILSVQAAVWRGDHTEVETARLLADLRFRNGDYRDAFTLVRELASIHEESTALADLLERAHLEFSALYIDGAADALDTIDALSIYYDFRHLTPAGSQGDQMIRNLAQRLIRVDLLAQAADLLEYQVDNRLQGAARAQVAADLAVIRLANREPAAALAAIHRTRLAGLPPALERQRRVLEARALIDAQRQDLALDLLSGITGRDTDLLRIEALWRSGRHGEAAEAIEALYDGDLARGHLSPVARGNIVRAGVGYVLADDRLGLSRLRSKYSALMSATPEWPMFAYVTDAVETDAREFRTVAREVAALDSLNAFLNAYREIYSPADALTPLRAARNDGAV